MRLPHAAGCLALAAVPALACRAPERGPSEVLRGPELRRDTVSSRPAPAPTVDDEWAAIADEVPGFAGLLAEGETLVVMLVDTTRLPAAERAVRQWREAPGRSFRRTVARPAVYDSRRLRDWKMLATEAMGRGGVAQVGIDVARNRLFVGVLDSSHVAPVRAALVARGVPAAAMTVAVTGPVRPLSDPGPPRPSARQPQHPSAAA